MSHTTTTTSQIAQPAPSRALWKGTITFGMLAVPVRVLSAVNERDITFTSIHKGCGAQLKQKMCCPMHESVDIELEGAKQRAYEVAKDQFVAISDDDMDQLPEPTKRVLTIEAFINATDVPQALHERTYFVQPDQIGLKPFSLFAAALVKRKRVAIGRITLRTRERLCLLRPENGGLVLETLLYPEELRAQPAPSIVAPTPQREELRLATMYIDALTKPFEMAEYPDTHRAAVLELVTRALEGSGAIANPTTPSVPRASDDLMAQLRASLEAVKKNPEAAA